MIKKKNRSIQITVLLVSTAIFCLFSCRNIMAVEDITSVKKTVQQSKTSNPNLVKKKENNNQGKSLVKNKEKPNTSVNKGKKSVPVMSEKSSKNTASQEVFSMPVSGTITSPFGYRRLTMQDGSVSNEMHSGLDIAAAMGTKICAAFGGTVKFAGVQEGYGNTIILSHANGVETLYGHCSKLCVSVGETVNKGDGIGEVGSTGRSTGPHVHFEVRVNGKAVNPINYINSRGVTQN